MIRSTTTFLLLCALFFSNCSKRSDKNPGDTPKVEFTKTMWLGIELEQVDNRLIVKRVINNSPALLAGIRAGDILTTLNDTEVSEIESLYNSVQRLDAYKAISLILNRNQASVTISLKPVRMVLFDDGVVSWGNGHCDKNCDCDGNDSTQCVSLYRYLGPDSRGGSSFAKYCTDDNTRFVRGCRTVILI